MSRLLLIVHCLICLAMWSHDARAKVTDEQLKKLRLNVLAKLGIVGQNGGSSLDNSQMNDRENPDHSRPAFRVISGPQLMETSVKSASLKKSRSSGNNQYTPPSFLRTVYSAMLRNNGVLKIGEDEVNYVHLQSGSLDAETGNKKIKKSVIIYNLNWLHRRKRDSHLISAEIQIDRRVLKDRKRHRRLQARSYLRKPVVLVLLDLSSSRPQQLERWKLKSSTGYIERVDISHHLKKVIEQQAAKNTKEDSLLAIQIHVRKGLDNKYRPLNLRKVYKLSHNVPSLVYYFIDHSPSFIYDHLTPTGRNRKRSLSNVIDNVPRSLHLENQLIDSRNDFNWNSYIHGEALIPSSGKVEASKRYDYEVLASAPKENRCSFRNQTVDLGVIAESSTILEPKVLDIGDCSGKCGKNSMYDRFTNHAAIGNIFEASKARSDYGESCCTPTKYSHEVLMYTSTWGHSVVKVYPDFKVTKCACQ